MQDVSGDDVTKTLDITVNGLDDVIVGGAANETLNGTAGRDIIMGEAGNDTIDGKAGADVMLGGKGNDTFIVDHASDAAIEFDNEGTDLVKSSVNYALGDGIREF